MRAGGTVRTRRNAARTRRGGPSAPPQAGRADRARLQPHRLVGNGEHGEDCAAADALDQLERAAMRAHQLAARWPGQGPVPPLRAEPRNAANRFSRAFCGRPGPVSATDEDAADAAVRLGEIVRRRTTAIVASPPSPARRCGERLDSTR
jgi:hypothetical protein